MSKVKVPAGLVSGEASLPGSQNGHLLAVSSHGLYSVHVERGGDGWCVILVLKGHQSYWIRATSF